MALGKLSPGQRARLASLGLDPAEVGKVFNRAGNGAPPRGPVDLTGITIPRNSEELAEMLADTAYARKVATNTNQLAAFIDEYAKTVQAPGTKLSDEVLNELKTSAQAAAIKWLQENEPASAKRLNLADAQWVGPQRKYAAGYNARAVGAGIDKEFEDSGDYFRHVWGYKHNRLNPTDRAKMDRILNTYTEMVPADGGFLVPETLRSDLLRVSLESAIVRSRARVIPMDTLSVMFPTIDATTNVGSVFGGMVAYWTEEAAALTASQAKFGRIKLEAWKLTGLAKVSNELLADSMSSFTALIDQLWPETLAWYEDLAFMTGTGVGEPLGFLANSATVAVAKESGQLADTVLWENVINMYARMLPASLNRAIWLASPDVFPQLATMALSVGTGGSAVWLNSGSSGPPATILGRPLILSEKMNALGNQGDLAFVDLGYYLIGDRQAMSAAVSEHSGFDSDLTTFRIIQRVTGRPWIQSAITPANGSATLSPFVELAERA